MSELKSDKWYLRLVKRFRNKYLLTFTIFAVYTLFIDDNDLITIINHHVQLNKIEKNLAERQVNLAKTRKILNKLNDTRYLEKYAREIKSFKKDDEDIFVITYK
ncbi:MAG TPA: hypothetical protein PLP27_10400 [Crocinitomicaceae bacterium]|nr:hypothetical protein [Crocinitomicaceae bacterium]